MPATAAHPPLTLDSLLAVSLSTATGDELPTRLVVAPWGEHDARKRGMVRVNERTLEAFAASQDAMRLDRVAIDFEHNTVPGTPAYEASAEPRKIAGYGTPVVLSNVGIVLEDIDWTPEGREALAGGHYQDLSPTAFRDDSGTVLGLHSVALCRHGELEGLTIQSAKAAAALLPLFTALSAEISPEETPALNSTMKEALLKLLKALGLEVTAEMDDDAVVALMSGYADKAAAKEVKEEEKPDAMSAELANVRAELDSVRKERLIDAARVQGKIIPLSAEAIKLTPFAVLEELCKAAKPGEVPLKGEKQAQVQEGGETKPDSFTAEELEVFAKFGHTAEHVAKTLGLEKAA